MIALVKIASPSAALLDLVKSTRKSKDISGLAAKVMGPKASAIVTTKIKCATENCIKLKVEVNSYGDLENLEWASILFADIWKMTYPLKEYPLCSVEYLDESNDKIGHFSTCSPRQELSLSGLTPRCRKQYSSSILSYISKP